jgi:hypothetical protein
VQVVQWCIHQDLVDLQSCLVAYVAPLWPPVNIPCGQLPFLALAPQSPDAPSLLPGFQPIRVWHLQPGTHLAKDRPTSDPLHCNCPPQSHPSNLAASHPFSFPASTIHLRLFVRSTYFYLQHLDPRFCPAVFSLRRSIPPTLRVSTLYHIPLEQLLLLLFLSFRTHNQTPQAPPLQSLEKTYNPENSLPLSNEVVNTVRSPAN